MITLNTNDNLVLRVPDSRSRNLRFKGADDFSAYFTDVDSGDDVTIAKGILPFLQISKA